MSENPGRKRKERDSTSDPNAYDHELSNPQNQAAGRKVKKKRTIVNLDSMYLGDSDAENKQGSESQKEADDITADDVVSSNDPYQEHKTKDSKRRHGDEAPDGEHNDLEVRPKKKKKKQKKDHEERLLEDLAEESLTADIQHVVRKKIRRQDGGGLLGGDDGSHRQHDFLEEPFSQGNNPDSSETAKRVNVKKKKNWRDEPNLEDDTTADETSSIVLHQDHKEKLKKSHKSKYLKTLCGGEDLLKPSVKKKLKKDCREHLLEEEESSTPDASEKKTKRKDGGDEHHRLHGFNEGPVTTDQAEDLVEELLIFETQRVSKKKKKKQKEGGGLLDDGFTERLVSQLECPEGSEDPEQVDENMEQIEKPVKKKKKKRKDEPRQEGDGLAVDDASSSVGLCEDEASYRELTEAEDRTSRKKKKSRKDQWERSLVEECEKNKMKQKDGESDGSRQQKHQGGAETSDQVDEHMGLAEKPVKKKKRKDKPHQEADGLAVDNESSSLGLHGAEPPYSEGTEIGDGSRRKKKSKEDHLEDMEESWTSDPQHESKKKTKRKDGGGENNRQDGFIVSKRKHDVGSESPEQMVDPAEERVKKKKKKKRSDRMEETSEALTEEMQLEGGEAPEVNRPYQGHVVEGGENVEGDAEENTGQASSSRRDGPQTPADADQNQDQTIQNEGDSRSTAADGNTEKAKKTTHRSLRFIREKDVALIREFFPKISESSLLNFKSHDLERIRAAKQNGILFRTGQFTIEEDEQIKENVERFMKEVGIDSPVMLFHPYKYPDLRKTISDLKRKFHFSQRIAVGLRRTVDEVLERGIRIYDPSTVRGRYTDEEVRNLKQYCEMYDYSNWVTVGSLMNRSYKTTQLKASQLRREVNTGRWSIEEMNRLIATVKEFVLNNLQKLKNTNEEPVTVPKELLYKGISWVKVEEKVETRNWTNCKIKWFTLIMLRMNDHIHPFLGTLRILNTIKIIQWFHDSQVKDYCDVKWDDLCDIIGNVPNTIVQNKFSTLKRFVPGWKNLRLYEIVEYLYSDILPKLEEMLAMANEIPIPPTKKTEFLIRDMFEEYSESYDFK